MDKPSDWVVLTQLLGYCPEGLVKLLTQLLVENNPIAGFVHILPSAGLYLTQHFLECDSVTSLFKETVHPNENSVINYSPSCRSKPARPSFTSGTQIKIFLKKVKFSDPA